MAIPGFQTLMLPVLRYLGDGQQRSTEEIRETLATQFQLTPEELAQLLPSGKQRLFVNRVAWALAYLKRAELIRSPKRAHYEATEQGRDVLASPPQQIDIKYLQQFPAFAGFRDGGIKEDASTAQGDDSGDTPEERLQDAHDELRRAVEQELLELIQNCSPSFFEQLVVDVIVAMGYGGSVKDAGKAVGKGGDGGIDGVIKEDNLGLDTIYLQAKRWSDTVSRPEIQKFAGALQGKKARKGIFITTSSYSTGAREFAAGLETTRIVLVDGRELARLMAAHGVGVTTVDRYEVNRVDQDYFAED